MPMLASTKRSRSPAVVLMPYASDARTPGVILTGVSFVV